MIDNIVPLVFLNTASFPLKYQIKDSQHFEMKGEDEWLPLPPPPPPQFFILLTSASLLSLIQAIDWTIFCPVVKQTSFQEREGQAAACVWQEKEILIDFRV